MVERLERKESDTRVKFEQIFETLDLSQRKTKIICTLGYVFCV